MPADKEDYRAEALLRWNSRARSGQPRPVFSSGRTDRLINYRGWVLRHHASEQKWQDMGCPDSAWRSIFPHSAANPRLKDIVRTTRRYRAGAVLFGTESGAQPPETSRISGILAAKRLGSNISIDDFGTEYSSFTFKMLPLDRIKLICSLRH